MFPQVEVITKLQDALKEVQIECSRHKAEAARAKEQVEELRRVVASRESDNEKLTEQWRKDKASYDKDLAAITKELEQVKSRHSSQVCTSSAYVGFVWLLLASAYLSSHKIFTVATVT